MCLSNIFLCISQSDPVFFINKDFKVSLIMLASFHLNSGTPAHTSIDKALSQFVYMTLLSFWLSKYVIIQ